MTLIGRHQTVEGLRQALKPRLHTRNPIVERDLFTFNNKKIKVTIIRKKPTHEAAAKNALLCSRVSGVEPLSELWKLNRHRAG